MKGIIYKYTSPENKSYIGQTINNIKVRAGKDGIGYKNCPCFWPAIQYFGWNNFTVEILCECMANTTEDLQQKLNEEEIYYIQYYNTVYPNGYNSALGGSGVGNRLQLDEDEIIRLFTEEKKTLRQIAEIFNVTYPTIISRLEQNNIDHSKAGPNSAYWDWELEALMDDIIDLYVNKKMSLDNIAKKYGYTSKDTIRRHLEYHGVKIRKGKSKRIRQLTLEGDYIQTFDTVQDAVNAVGLKSKSSISNVLAGRAKSAGGYLWEAE